MPRIMPIRGSTGDWILRLECDQRSKLLSCIKVIGEQVPRVRLELSQREDGAECAVELVSHQRAGLLLEALRKFYRGKKGTITYSLGNVNAGTIDTGVLLDR